MGREPRLGKEIKLTVDGKSIELTIDQLKALGLYNEEDIEKEKEQFFLDHLNGCTICIDAQYPDSVIYNKNGQFWAEWNAKTRVFSFSFISIDWPLFRLKFNCDIEQTKQFITKMVYKYLKYDVRLIGNC